MSERANWQETLERGLPRKKSFSGCIFAVSYAYVTSG
jgi:hypothetical protein